MGSPFPHGAPVDAWPDRSATETAWLVLEAANDLGDQAAVEACRRVIDAELRGAPASPTDIEVVVHYFR